MCFNIQPNPHKNHVENMHICKWRNSDGFCLFINNNKNIYKAP